MTITREEQLSLLDEVYYQKNGYPYAAWDKIRAEDPIHFVEREGGESYWAVTRHQDIEEIQSQPEIFENGPKLAFGNVSEGNVRMIINMDPPDHRVYRNLVNKKFMPKSLEWVEHYAREISTDTIDKAMVYNGETMDLMEHIAGPLPTAVICSFLGVPKELWPKVLEWTDLIIGAVDPDFSGGMDPMEYALQAMAEMTSVYADLFEDRKKNPQDDLLTDLIKARINGQPIPDLELYSFCHILNTAGHETTKNTIGAAIHLLANHPDQMAKVKSNLDLIPQMIEEVLRYASPAVHFCRTPNQDTEVNGKKIRAGETMVMFYPSANRDPEIFDNPNQFDIERKPNNHLAFGVGAHGCLGKHLARMELRCMFEELLPRLGNIEIISPPEMVQTCIVGGIKRLQVRATLLPKK